MEILKDIKEILDLTISILGSLCIICTIVVRLIPLNKNNLLVSLITYLPTLGINPRTKTLLATVDNLARNKDTSNLKPNKSNGGVKMNTETPTVEYGTKELEEAILVVAEAIKGYEKSMENDGEFKFDDIGNFIPALVALGPAIQDIDQVPKEVGNLSAEEFASVSAKVIAMFGDGVKPHVRDIVDGSLKVIVGGLIIVKGIKASKES